MSRTSDPDWDGVRAYNSPNAVSERLEREVTELRAELAKSEDWIRLLEKTHSTNNRLANERRSAAARQDAEEKAQLREALELIQGFGWQLDDSAHGNEIKRRARAALACRPQGERSETWTKTS